MKDPTAWMTAGDIWTVVILSLLAWKILHFWWTMNDVDDSNSGMGPEEAANWWIAAITGAVLLCAVLL